MKSSQGGFAMLLVMILVAVGVILGMSYLATASLDARISHNFHSLARARYLAESGLEHGLYVLRHSPEQFEDAGGQIGPFYVEGAVDRYFIVAQPDLAEPGRYTLTSTAYVGDVQRTSSVTVYRAPAAVIDLHHGLLVGGGVVWTPWNLSISGDVHVNGSVFNLAAINGHLTATGVAVDLCGRVSGGADGAQEPVSVPQIRVQDYTSYILFGRGYSAVEFAERDLHPSNPLCRGGAVTPSNPGGVVHLRPPGGEVGLKNGFQFTGTLIIEGDVRLEGNNVRLTAVEGFPAIVATGSLVVTDSARNVSINGLVVADQGIVPSGPTFSANTVITGGLISRNTGYDSLLFGDHKLQYDEQLSAIYDFSLPVEQRVPPVEILSWND